MDRFELYRETSDILNMIDSDALPQIREYLGGIMQEDESVAEDPYVIANELLKRDGSGELPEFVRDFIEKLFSVSLGEGNAEAANDLGAQYYNGARGFAQDYRKAVEYYELAAEKGSRQAQENLGYCYYYGRSVPVDYEKAFGYFALGAFDGHIVSLYKIGDMYQRGLYVKKDLREAFLIYGRCLDTMTPEAEPEAAGPVYLRMGNAYLNGWGTEENAVSALVCFQKAEFYLFSMVQRGEDDYRKSLADAIIGQNKARLKLAAALPGGQIVD